MIAVSARAGNGAGAPPGTQEGCCPDLTTAQAARRAGRGSKLLTCCDPVARQPWHHGAHRPGPQNHVMVAATSTLGRAWCGNHAQVVIFAAAADLNQARPGAAPPGGAPPG